MSTIEDRIVALKFDNSGFEAGATKAISILDKLGEALKFKDTGQALDSVKNSLSNFNMDGVTSSVEEASGRFSAFEALVTGIFINLGSRVADFGINMAKSLTVKPLMDGFSEYELQMKSVQTILSNSGAKLKEQGFTTQEEQIGVINARLDELNTYADKTIYNFSEMTRNIGTFTAAGVDLDTATKSIQGIANLAAASGSSSQQASTAMYQLSQAIAAGSLKLQDWNSVVNAGMGGELFQEALKRTARNFGTDVDSMIKKAGSFRESLSEGWITSDVLTTTLEQLTMSYEDVGDAAYNTNYEILKNQGYSDEDAKAILELAKNAEDAATKVRTWTQLWDTVGEALGSGWATTWRTIVGDFLEATDLFTHLSNGITGIIEASSNARNAVLADWAAAGGRTALVDGIKFSFDAIMSIVRTFGEAFSDVFGISARQLFNISAAFSYFAEKMVPSKEVVQFLYDALYNVFTIIRSVIAVFGNFVRIVVHVAGVVWKLISPLVKLAAIMAVGILKGLAITASFINKLSDKVEFFARRILRKFGSAIDFVYGGIGKVLSVLGGLFGAVKNLVSVVPGLAGAFLNFVSTLPAVQAIKDAFQSIYNLVSGKVTSAFEALHSLIFGTKKEASKTVMAVANPEKMSLFERAVMMIEEFQSKIGDFIEGFSEAEDKAAYLGEILNPFFDGLKKKAREFFKIVSSPEKMFEWIDSVAENFSKSLNDFFGGGDVANRISTAFDKAYASVKGFIEGIMTLGSGDSVLDSIVRGIAGSIIRVKKTFDNLKKYFSDLAKSGKSIPEILATIFFDAYDKIKEWVTNFPELMSKARTWIVTEFGKLSVAFQNVKQNFGQKFKEMLSNLPSPEEIRSAISNFVRNVATVLSEKMSDLKTALGKGGGPSFDFTGFFKAIPEAFKNASGYLSQINLSLPADFVKKIFSGIWSGISEGLSSFIDTIPVDGIVESLDKLIEKLKTIIMKRPWMIALSSVVDFIRSLSVMNRGIGKLGKGFSKSFKSFGENIRDGLTNFGQGFTSFKKQTKAQAFMRIAAGMLLLAGALWVMAQIPSDRLAEVAIVLGILGLAISGLMVAISAIAKAKDLDLEGVGKGIAGFGIGLLALAGAVWVMSKIPAEDADENINRVMHLIFMVGTALAAISLAGGNLKGAAATLIAMGVAITLLMIPIQILGRTPDDVLKKGGNATGMIMAALTGAIAIMELANVHKGSILGAAPTLLALAASIILAIIPIEILGREDIGIIKQGGNAVGQIAIVLGLAIGLIGGLGKHAMSILAATPALLALTVATTLMIIPIKILGNTDKTVLHQGGNAVGLIAVVLTGAMAILGMAGMNVGGILAGTVGLLGLTVAVAAMSLVVAGLAKVAEQNPQTLKDAVDSVLWIVIALVTGLLGLSVLGGGAAVGLIAIAAGIAVFAGALYLLAGAISYFQTSVDWKSIGEAISGFVNIIKTAITNMGADAVAILTGIVGSFKQKAIEAISGFVNGIASRVGSVKTTVGNVSKSAVDSFKNLPSNFKKKASEAMSGFISSISSRVSSARSAASGVANAAKNALGSLVGSFRDVGRNAVQGFVEGISSVIGAVRGKVNELASLAEKAVKAKLKIKSPSRVFREIGSFVGEGFILGVSDRMTDVERASERLAGIVPQSFMDNLETISINDLFNTDYTPTITPVINTASFDSGIDHLASSLGNVGSLNLSVGDLNYSGQLVGKMDDFANVNKAALEAIADNNIDYDRLGVSVANALINAGVHVEMDGGELMGYIAGEIRDVRRMYG